VGAIDLGVCVLVNQIQEVVANEGIEMMCCE